MVTANGGVAVGQSSRASFANSVALGTNATTVRANQVMLGGAGSSTSVGDIAASTAAQTGAVSFVTVDATGTLGQGTLDVSGLVAGQAVQDTRLTALEGVTATQATQIAAVQTTQAAQGTVLVQHTAQIMATSAQVAQQGVTIANMQTGMQVLNTQIAGISSKVDQLFAADAVNKKAIGRANEGVALALALESPAVPADGKFALSMGAGFWEGRSAASIAMSYRIAPSATVSGGVGVGLNSGKVGGRVGFQVAW